MDGKSLNITEEKINNLKKILPEAFTEGKIDWEKLKAALGEDIEFRNERYVLNWAGKSDAFRVLQAPTTATLVPCKEESVKFDDTGNIFVEGENLEVLKVLQKSYFGKIKMIYIDPPYNTGNDNFIYPDKFSETKEEYLERIGDKDETGYMTREGLFRKNSRDSGHYHSNWLSMMYPRLFLARNLLREDGVIFVSIDDNEVHNLRLLMNEVFGEENFVSCLVWKKSYGGGAKTKYVVGLHEYILVFAKNKECIEKIELPPSQDVLKYYKWKDEKFDYRGPYRKQPLATNSMDERPNLRFPINRQGHEIWPEKQWQWSKDRVMKALNSNELIFKNKNNKWNVEYKQYLKDENGEERGAKPYSLIEGPYTQVGTGELTELFGNSKTFSFPKPIGLIKYFIQFIDKNDIILDFFSGSGTTAHAVLDLNKQDNGNRKFICIQLPEKCDEKTEAFKGGYKSIAEIGKERIRRVIKKIKEDEESKEPNLFSKDKPKQDLGFKVFKLQESNFKIWRPKVKNEEELFEQLTFHTDPVDENAETENILYELLLKSGIPLTAGIED
ncbi:MAG: site-specific DNA-methyltransferase, partial [Pseudomonadota bacterium]